MRSARYWMVVARHPDERVLVEIADYCGRWRVDLDLEAALRLEHRYGLRYVSDWVFEFIDGDRGLFDLHVKQTQLEILEAVLDGRPLPRPCV